MTRPTYQPHHYQPHHHQRISSGTDIPDLAAPTPKPPSIFHSFKGDVRAQDLFIGAIEAQRGKGERHKILYPGSDDFEMERMDVWNHDAICTPCLILQPSTTREVSSCIRGYTAGVRKCLSENRRTGSNLGIPRLCIAGGRNSVASMKEGAIVVDLSLMRSVSVDVENRTVAVQGGARVHDLDMECGHHGLMCVSGTSQSLGVVGCILGGGVGYASRKHGLAADNVLSADIVLADGSVRRCSPRRHEDIFWSLKGGGGGIGVVTSLKLRCYPLKNAVALTFDLLAPTVRYRKNVLKKWGQWFCGTNDLTADEATACGDQGGVPREVFSQLILPTNSSTISFLATSVDPEIVPQSEGRLEQYRYLMRKKSKTWGLFGAGSSIDSQLPTVWERVPGLDELRSNKLGAPVRSNSKFEMMRYFDELQRLSVRYFKPGNAYVSCKYARSMSPHVIAVLVEAVTGSSISPSNESRIVVSSAGGAIGDTPEKDAAFGSRDANYVIYVEGRWTDSVSESRDQREREKVVKWVHWVSNQLHFCEGVCSTAHPESTRDHVSKSGRSEPPSGWYNFGKLNGERLASVKRKRDPRNVFSLASRVSWRNPPARKGGPASVGGATPSVAPDASVESRTMKEGEVSFRDCITPDRSKGGSSEVPGKDMEADEKSLSPTNVMALDAELSSPESFTPNSCSSDDKVEIKVTPPRDPSRRVPNNSDRPGQTANADLNKQTSVKSSVSSLSSGSEGDLENWVLAPFAGKSFTEEEGVDSSPDDSYDENTPVEDENLIT